MTSTLSSFTTRDGTRIVYELHGNTASADRVALIHSLAMDHNYWKPVADRLAAAGVCAVALDCRGHGESGKPKGPYFITTFANDVAELFDHLSWNAAVVAGSSMGGSVALAVAAGHPHRVKGLALIDTTAFYGADAPKAWAQRAQAAQEKGLASLIDFQLTRWFGDAFKAAHPDLVQGCVDTFLKNDVAAYAATCRMLGDFDLRASLPHFRMPVGIVVGEEDYATPPAMAEEMNAAIPQSTYLVLDKARHLTPLERPDEVAAEILKVVKAAR